MTPMINRKTVVRVLLGLLALAALGVGGCWVVKKLTPKPPKPDKTEMYFDRAERLLEIVIEAKRDKNKANGEVTKDRPESD